MSLLAFYREHLAELLLLLRQHLVLVVVSTVLALAGGLPLGILVSRRPAWRKPILALTNVVQTVPSLALFGLLIPLLGIGAWTAITALVFYALLPIVRNTYAGIVSVDPAIREAGRGMGLGDGELAPWVGNPTPGCVALVPRIGEAGAGMGLGDGGLLRLVELPLAAGVILAGIRVAVVVSVGIATIAAAIGAGGLGVYIFRGVATVNDTLILAGALPTALLALLADGLLSLAERKLVWRAR